MTTAVADIADLVKILREQPEWAETLRSVLLSKELLELPEKLAQLTEQVTRLTARLEEFIAEQREINQRFAEQLAQLTARLEEFIAEQREINRVFAERLTRLETDTAELKSDTAELKVGLRRLEGTVGSLADTVGSLEGTVGSLADTVGSLEGTVGSLAGTVGRLQGAELERKIHANIAGMVCTPLGIRRPRVLKSILAATVPALFDLLDPAQDAGRISRAQFDSLMQTDIILTARDGNAQPVYVAIEISRTVHDDDLERARERADILAAASGTTALALVIGYIIPPPQRRKAAEMAVHLMETASLSGGSEAED